MKIKDSCQDSFSPTNKIVSVFDESQQPESIV